MQASQPLPQRAKMRSSAMELRHVFKSVPCCGTADLTIETIAREDEDGEDVKVVRDSPDRF